MNVKIKLVEHKNPYSRTSNIETINFIDVGLLVEPQGLNHEAVYKASKLMDLPFRAERHAALFGPDGWIAGHVLLVATNSGWERDYQKLVEAAKSGQAVPLK